MDAVFKLALTGYLSIALLLSQELTTSPEISEQVPLATRRPNIVLIVSDDHGREAVGCYGNTSIRTPHIDQLATDGVRFSNAFCTTASCSPSRSVLLTGIHNHANGMYGLEHQAHHFSSFDTVRSLPVWLAQAGYRVDDLHAGTPPQAAPPYTARFLPEFYGSF